MRRIFLHLFSILFCVAAIVTALYLPRAAAQITNWPQWRGHGGLAISAEKNLPDEWSGEKNVLWKTPISGRGHSSPIIWEKRVFLTTSIEGELIPDAKPVAHVRAGKPFIHPDSVAGARQHTLKVLCLDRDTGKLLWERTAYEGRVYDDRHRKGAYASSTPATDGRYVYAFFEAEGLYCYDFNGKLIWKSSLGKIAKMGLGPGVSPVLHENLVILQCDQEDGGTEAGSFIAAVNKRTGKEVWRVARTHRKTWATPLVVRTRQGAELIASGAETIIAYDPKTGQELWRCDGVRGHAIPSAVAGLGMVFVTAGYPSKRALAIRPGARGDITNTSNVAWHYDKGTAYVTSPILYGDYFYIVSDKGVITCFDAKTGALKYEGGRVPIPATFTSSAIAFDGKLLLTSEDGDTFVIKAGAQHEVIRTNSIGEPVFASLAIADSKIFIRGDKHLFCIGGKTSLVKAND